MPSAVDNPTFSVISSTLPCLISFGGSYGCRRWSSGLGGCPCDCLSMCRLLLSWAEASRLEPAVEGQRLPDRERTALAARRRRGLVHCPQAREVHIGANGRAGGEQRFDRGARHSIHHAPQETGTEVGLPDAPLDRWREHALHGASQHHASPAVTQLLLAGQREAELHQALVEVGVAWLE